MSQDDTIEPEVRRLLEDAGPRPPRPEVAERDLAAIKAAFRAEWEAQVGFGGPLPKRPARGRLLALAAGLLAAVGLGWWTWTVLAPVPPAARVAAVRGEVFAVAGPPLVVAAAERARLAVDRELAPGTVVESAADDPNPAKPAGTPARAGRAALRLAGGAEVRLDAGSRVRLASATVVELERGAIYLDSGADPIQGPAAGGAGSLTVLTPAGEVHDVGTQFEVRLPAAGDPALRVRVRSGGVEVHRGGAVYPAAAGTELTVAADGAVSRTPVAAYGEPWAWTATAAPRFAIEGKTLAEFLAWAGRETGRRARFEDPALAATAGTTVLHGALGDVTPEQATDLLLSGAGLRGRIEGDELVVSAASRADN